MSNICIVTDSTAQLSQYPTNQLVSVIPLYSRIGNAVYSENDTRHVSTLPATADDTLYPRLQSPPFDRIYQGLATLIQAYDQIIVLAMSSKLSDFYTQAQEAANLLRGGKDILVIDTQTTSVGLGYLVEIAAEAIHRGDPIDNIVQYLRSVIPHIYSVLCTPGPSYLFYNGFIDRAQATISEMLGLYPIFAIEEGQLTPIDKVRSHRNTANIFQEFLDEFDELEHITILQGTPPLNAEFQLLRDHVHDVFPKTPYHTQNINLALATLFGPKTIGLFLQERLN